MTVSPTLNISQTYSIVHGHVDNKLLEVPTSIIHDHGNEKSEISKVETNALIDSGAEGEFIDQNYAWKLGIKQTALEELIKVLNVDGTWNKRGTITHYTELDLQIGERIERQQLYITGLGKQKIILGFTWLHQTNPDINWQTGDIRWRPIEANEDCAILPVNTPEQGSEEWVEPRGNETLHPSIEEVKDEEEWKNSSSNESDLDDFNEIIIRYIGTDESLMDLWNGPWPDEEDFLSEISINATLSPSQEFVIKQDEGKEKQTVEEIVPPEYYEYLDIFQEEVVCFPKKRTWDHAIDMKNGFEPKAFRSYNLTPEEQHQQAEFIQENLKKGYIRPSKSPMASPFFFVLKKDGRLRPTQDYRYLNQWTVKNAHPLPLISDIMDKIKDSGAKYFTKFDIWWGYNNVRIKEGDEWKAAFKTNMGLFEPTVMFFGLCNSLATFQAMINDILKDELAEGGVIVYMDDILIFSKTKDKLEELTKRVLQRLRENDLYLKPGKCEFCKTRIEYLGLIIEEGKMMMDPGKLNGIRDWPIPKTVKQVRSWLGFGNFYRRFIKGFSHLAQPLNQLLKKDRPFLWDEDAQ